MNHMETILVVDDEVNIRVTLRALLTRAGYHVIVAASGEEALTLLTRHRFDLFVVDLQMPGIQGMEVVAEVRRHQPNAVMIVLTGHGSVETAVEGLHLGIFDYLLKTADPSHVVARVEAGLAMRKQQMRQQALLESVSNAVEELRSQAIVPPIQIEDDPMGQPSEERLISAGDLQIDTWRQTATFAGRMLPLTPTEFRVLLCLAEQAGHMLTYTEIVRCAQGYDATELEAGDLVKPHIYHLRQKLEPDPTAPRYLLNVRGKGYLLQL